MSKNLERVIQRAISDAAFRRQLQSNPEAALRGFKLTDSEIAALRSGDANKLTSLGIDQRMSKTFSFGGDSLASRAAIGGDLTSGAGMSNADRDPRMDAALEGGNTSGATRNVIPTDPSGSTPAFDPGVTGNTTSVGDPMFDGRATSVIADPDNPASARTYIGGQAAPTSDALEDQSHAFAASRSADVGGSVGYSANYPEHGGLAGQSSDAGGSTVGYSANYPEHGGLAGQSADVASSARESVIGDPDNPAFARGYTGGEQGASATTSNIGDPDNPASARTFTGGQAASASDAIEDQSHAFAATRDQGATGATASNIGDPDNPANARGYIGEQTASTSDAIEDQSHAFAATRDQGASTVSASNIGDPDNPANARGYIGEPAASTSDAIEDQSHAFAATRDQGAAPTSDALEDQSHVIASRADAFLSEGEVSQYSDPSLSTGQAVDEGQLFSGNTGDMVPDDGGTASVHHEPDVPS